MIRPLQSITLKNEGGEDTNYTLDSTYPDLTAGAAEQIISDDYTENKVPYLLRASNFGSKREDDTIVGGTVAWNQLQKNTVSRTNNYVTYTYSNGALSIVGTSSPASYWIANADTYKWDWIENHVYLFDVGNPSYVGGSNYRWYISATFGSNPFNIMAPTVIGKCTATGSSSMQFVVYNGNSIDLTFHPQCFDLTQMFGSTIANYIYSLEQATTGAGVAWFKALFPKPYYAYNAGELMSVSGVSEHKMVGKNLIDDSIRYTDGNQYYIGNQKTYTILLAAGTYTFSVDFLNGSHYGAFYKEENATSGTTIWGSSAATSSATITLPAGKYMFWLYKSGGVTPTDIGNIQLQNGSSATTYEPFKTWSYPLDSSLTLRGVPKLDANNSLYYDGDTYESDGTVTRKYGIVDLGTLTWIKWTQGTNIIFYGGVSDAKSYPTKGTMPNAHSSKYEVVAVNDRGVLSSTGLSDKQCSFIWSAQNFAIRDDSLASGDAAAFKTAMSGVYLVYELATYTTETADPYTNPQTVDPDGTEEYVSTSIVPVGHETKYFADLVSRLASIPEPPTSNGTYRLIATVSGGVATLSWVAN